MYIYSYLFNDNLITVNNNNNNNNNNNKVLMRHVSTRI